MLHEFFEQGPSKAASTSRVATIVNVSRRTFLGVSAAGFALAAFTDPAAAFTRYRTGGEDMDNGLRTDPQIFVSLDADGTVTIVAHRSEMGTGSRTSLPMVLADEMGADWAKVKIVQAEGDEPKYGNQDTDGSRSMRHHIQTMRQMGAAMRFMLVGAAADLVGADRSEFRTDVHEIVHVPSGRKIGFGELADRMSREDLKRSDMPYVGVPAFEELAFRDETEFRYIGKGNVPIIDLHGITVGQAVYGADVRVPGMKFSVVARPPVVGGKVKTFEAEAAKAVPGVEAVIEIPGAGLGSKFAPLGGVAVVATNTWAALQGRDKLNVTWEDGEHASYDSKAFLEEMRATAKEAGKVLREKGDVDGAMKSGKTFTAEYTQKHMAHAPMEPPAALVSVADGKAEVWAPVQSPWGTRGDVAALLGIEVDAVKVNVTLLGGGFGRKSKCDFVLEAAFLSKAVGAPVRVQWSRTDDVQHSFYHTTSVERLEAAIDDNGKVVALRHNSTSPTIASTFAPDSGYLAAFERGMGLVDNPFAIESMRIENGKAMSHARIGWFRSVNNIQHAFAVQSFAAELANELKRDQKEMLLELIGPARHLDPAAEGVKDALWNYGEDINVYPIDTGRLANVLNVAADAAGWGQSLPDGEGLGLAVHRSFVSYIAMAVHVKVVDAKITVPAVHVAVDCGFVANPERVRSQMEGATVMGMTLALHSGIDMEEGRVVQTNFHDYPVVRADNYPMNVAVHIVPHPFEVHASGIGEPGVPPFAPALANALFNATGQRLRDLPLGETV